MCIHRKFFRRTEHKILHNSIEKSNFALCCGSVGCGFAIIYSKHIAKEI